jgi:hypothetical protein
MGSAGKSSKAVWVEVMTLPLGSQTLMPAVVSVFPTQGLSVFKKWPVQPESAKA